MQTILVVLSTKSVFVLGEERAIEQQRLNSDRLVNLTTQLREVFCVFSRFFALCNGLRKAKSPNHISVYFNCRTVLVETFKELYMDTFSFVGNREIILPLSKPIPMQELKHCISMSLRYHSIKHLPLLGA